MKKSAFTLIELSIVLIIIGLIIGSILGGQELIKQAKIRSLITEMNGLKTSLNAFKLKYDFYPGDLPNATTFWPSTTNGNGDANVNNSEPYYVFQQLGLSQIIPGSYMGGPSGGSYGYLYGQNTYASKYTPAVYVLFGSATFFSKNWLTLFTIGSMDATSCSVNDSYNGGFITPADAYSIDLKIDDAIPSSGRLLAIRACAYVSNSSKCISSDQYTYTPGGASYLLNDSSTSCRLELIIE